MKTLTIIIPTYNMERYLDGCLESLMIENGRERLEVLIINDGSKDRSSEIAHGWSEKYQDMIRVIDKENGNYGSCINRGLAEATGKYVKILDADDRYDTQNLQRMVETMEKVDVDVVITDYVLTGGNTIHKKYYAQQLPHEEVFSLNSYCAEPHFQDVRMHSVAYRTEMLREIGYRQAEGISFTDVQWIFLPLTMAQTAYYIPIPVYRYLIGRAGQTVDPAQKRKQIPSAQGLAEALVEDFIKPTGKPSTTEKRTYLKNRLMPVLKSVYRSQLVEFNPCNTHRLYYLDRKIETELPEIFHELGDMRLLPVVGIHFIRRWRRGHYTPLPAWYTKVYNTYARLLNTYKRLTRQTSN